MKGYLLVDHEYNTQHGLLRCRITNRYQFKLLTLTPMRTKIIERIRIYAQINTLLELMDREVHNKFINLFQRINLLYM